ncbi:MAG: hypothetical protein PHT36_01495 [Patescibacteria group bacterium]|nr:hypothetical protein [Patescibacteria group bacterium]
MKNLMKAVLIIITFPLFIYVFAVLSSFISRLMFCNNDTDILVMCMFPKYLNLLVALFLATICEILIIRLLKRIEK